MTVSLRVTSHQSRELKQRFWRRFENLIFNLDFNGKTVD